MHTKRRLKMEKMQQKAQEEDISSVLETTEWVNTHTHTCTHTSIAIHSG